jgi:hypothetical protein
MQEEKQASALKPPPGLEGRTAAVGTDQVRSISFRSSKALMMANAPWKTKGLIPLLVVLCIVLTAVFAGYFLYASEKAGQDLRRIETAPVGSGIKYEKTAGADFTRVQFLLKKRNIFSLVPVARTEGGDVIGDREEIAEFRLVGILWSDTPQAMVENVQEQKTYLVARNDAIGNFKVNEIKRDSVVIEKNGKVWDLR